MKIGIYSCSNIFLHIIIALITILTLFGCKKEKAPVNINEQNHTVDWLPILSTNTVTEITQNSAICGGFIYNDGGSTIISRGVCWNTNKNPTIADNKTNNGTGEGNFLSNITGLSNNITYYVRAYATSNIGTGYGNEASFIAGTITDIDGNVYRTINIGTQTWIAENLKTTHYRNGDSIAYRPYNNWDITNSGAYCYYNNDTSNLNTYGRIYNWYAISDSRNIAPIGWHIPSDAEWVQLVDYLGGNNIAGGKMKETGFIHWQNPNTGANNSSGFTGLPGGCRLSSNPYYGIKESIFWWSTTVENNDLVVNYNLGYSSPNANRSSTYKKTGMYIRCIKD